MKVVDTPNDTPSSANETEDRLQFDDVDGTLHALLSQLQISSGSQALHLLLITHSPEIRDS